MGEDRSRARRATGNVTLTGVPIGALRPTYSARGDRNGWQPLLSGQSTPTETAAAAALIGHLDTLRHLTRRRACR